MVVKSLSYSRESEMPELATHATEDGSRLLARLRKTSIITSDSASSEKEFFIIL